MDESFDLAQIRLTLTASCRKSRRARGSADLSQAASYDLLNSSVDFASRLWAAAQRHSDGHAIRTPAASPAQGPPTIRVILSISSMFRPSQEPLIRQRTRDEPHVQHLAAVDIDPSHNGISSTSGARRGGRLSMLPAIR